MREHVVESKVCEHAEALGWLVRKISYPGVRGAPDRHFYKSGRLILVEFKRRGAEPDGLQRREHARLKAAGFPVHVIDDIDAGKALFT
jgi:hypothetical protein